MKAIINSTLKTINIRLMLGLNNNTTPHLVPCATNTSYVSRCTQAHHEADVFFQSQSIEPSQEIIFGRNCGSEDVRQLLRDLSQ